MSSGALCTLAAFRRWWLLDANGFRPPMTLGRARLFSARAQCLPVALGRAWRLDARGLCLMVAFRRARLLSPRGCCPSTSICRSWRFAVGVIPPFASFVRARLLDASVFCLSAAISRARILSSNVLCTRAAFRHWRLLSPRGDFPLASFISPCALASRSIEHLSRYPHASIPPPCDGDESDPHGNLPPGGPRRSRIIQPVRPPEVFGARQFQEK